MSAKVTRRAAAGRERLDRLLALDGATIEIGDPRLQYREPSGRYSTTVQRILMWHEFGLGVPQRPVLRPTILASRAELARRLAASARRAADGEATDAALLRAGKWLSARLVDALESGISPPLSPATLDDDYPRLSDHPLLKTGQIRKLLRSVRVVRAPR